MNRFVAVWVCLAAAASMSAQSRPPAPRPAARSAAPAKATTAPKKEMPVPFQPGEVLEYDIGWSSYVTAGTATITVKEKKPSYNSVAYYIVAEGRPTPLLSKLYTLYYKADTLIDAFTLLPQRGSLYVEEGKRHRMKTTTFDQTTKHATYEVQSSTHAEKAFSIPGFTQDALSALYVLRSIPMKPSDKFNMPVTDAGDVYKVQMQVMGSETMKTALGTLSALKIVPLITTEPGKKPPSGITIWISEDSRHLPVKIEAPLTLGTFVITLRKAAGV
jgi:hypothetical protein